MEDEIHLMLKTIGTIFLTKWNVFVSFCGDYLYENDEGVDVPKFHQKCSFILLDLLSRKYNM